MGYTKKQILERLEKASVDMSLFYKLSCINYRGRTTDTKEYYTEVISEWLLSNLYLLDNISVISRNSSYYVGGHDGIPENMDSNRKEELIAMEIFRQGNINIAGKILDYQTPLKNIRKDKAGKIDLISYDGQILYLLELKEPDSKETMLRCVLEGYTYFKTLDVKKLINNFNKDGNAQINLDAKMIVCPFVFYKKSQYNEMQEERPQLKKLMKKLNCYPLYIDKNEEKYIIKEQ